MKNTSQTLLQIITFLLIFLWVYAAASKLMVFSLFKVQMFRQPFPHGLVYFIIYTLPATEFMLAALLATEKSRISGFKISSGLLMIFNIYILLILLHVFGKVPCSCGGLIQALGWKLHFVFNLFFLLLSFLGIYIGNRERRSGNKKV